MLHHRALKAARTGRWAAQDVSNALMQLGYVRSEIAIFEHADGFDVQLLIPALRAEEPLTLGDVLRMRHHKKNVDAALLRLQMKPQENDTLPTNTGEYRDLHQSCMYVQLRSGSIRIVSEQRKSSLDE